MNEEGYMLVDQSKLSIPANTAIRTLLTDTLKLFEEQKNKLYNLSNSPVFKTGNPRINDFQKNVIFKIEDKLNLVKEKLKIVDVVGGGLFGFVSKKKPNTEELLELILSDLTESIEGEKIKFNALFNNIKLYVYTIEKDEEKESLILDNILTKMATFEVIISEIISNIDKFRKIAPYGGKKRRTLRRKQVKRRTHATKKSKKH